MLNSPRAGIGGETNRVTLVEPGRVRALPVLPKREVAEHVMERAIELRGAKRTARKARGSRIRRAARTAR